MKRRGIFVVSSSNKSKANSEFKKAELGGDTFLGAGFGESPNGKASHFICSIVDEESVILKLEETGLFERVDIRDPSDSDIQKLMDEFGIVPITPRYIKEL